MYYSKYNVDFIDGDSIIVVNMLSASMVRFDKKKFQELKNANIDDVFSKKEIDSLIKTGILCTENNETEILVAKREKLFNEQLDKSFSLTILTTTNCNARCFYCYENGVEKRDMTIDTADDLYKYIINNRKDLPVFLNWFGGEPLYNSPIIDYICSRLKKDNIIYSSSMASNGYLIDQYRNRILDLWNLKSAQITIDGIGENYNRIKNYIYEDADPFARIIDNIKYLLNNQVHVSLRINFNPQKLQDAINTIRYIHQEFGNNLGLYVYCAWVSDEHILSPNNFNPWENPLLELYSVLMECGYISKLSDLGIRPKLLTCSLHKKNMVVVNVDGTLHKCQHGIMNNLEDSFGNIYDGVTNIKNLEYWSDIQYPSIDCMNCVCLPICEGGCKYRAIHNNGKDVCVPIKYCLKEVLSLFYKKYYTK